MSQRPAPSIVADALRHSYGKGSLQRPVLQGLSLRFSPGELCLVMGASGSGKSTLLATLSGLLRPESGRVQVLGSALWVMPAAQLEAFRFRHFGFVFQGFNLFPALTALEQVALPLRYGGVSRSDAQQRALKTLGEVGLSGHASLRPAELSGGEKQRVAIARALARQPQILFADEPTSALDSHNSDVVMDLLRRIAAQRATTVIVVTHDPRLCPHADRVIELQDGHILSDSQHSSTQRAAA